MTFAGESKGSNGEQPSQKANYKICIRPHYKKRPSSVWQALDIFDMVNTVSDGDHFVYIYDEARRSYGRSIRSSLPDWVVNKTLNLLRERETASNERAAALSQSYQSYSADVGHGGGPSGGPSGGRGGGGLSPRLPLPTATAKESLKPEGEPSLITEEAKIQLASQVETAEEEEEEEPAAGARLTNLKPKLKC
jgi:hypothetical protein